MSAQDGHPDTSPLVHIWLHLSCFQQLLGQSDSGYQCAWSGYGICYLYNIIAPWLLQLSVTGWSNLQISWTNMHKYIASFTVWVFAMYSASVLDNAMIYCFFELQVTALVPMWNEYLEIECLCACPAQSASQNPSRTMFPCPLNIISQRSLCWNGIKWDLFWLETKHSDKELYWIIAQYKPVQMISY